MKTAFPGAQSARHPQKSFHVKKGDEVVVISGSQRGKRGKVLEILKSKNRLRVEGLAMIKKSTRKSQLHPEGGIFEKEGSIHVSNVMLADLYAARKQPSKAKK